MWEAGAGGSAGGFDATPPARSKRPMQWSTGADDTNATPTTDFKKTCKYKERATDPQAFPANKPPDETWVKTIKIKNHRTGAETGELGLLINMAKGQDDKTDAIKAITASVSGYNRWMPDALCRACRV